MRSRLGQPPQFGGSRVAVAPTVRATSTYTAPAEEAFATFERAAAFDAAGAVAVVGEAVGPPLDAFDRTDGDVGSNWTADPRNAGYAIPQIVSNQLKGVSAGGFRSAWWNAAQFGPDCEATITAVDWTGTGNQKGIRLFLRVTEPGTAGFDGYQADFVANTGSGTHDLAVLSRWNNGAQTFLAFPDVTKYQDGDELKFEVAGTVLTMSRRRSGSWSTLATYDDSAAPLSAAGYVGVQVDDDLAIYDNFYASPEVVAPVVERSASLDATGTIATAASFYTIFTRTAAISATAAVASVPQRVRLRAAAVTATGNIATAATFYSILTRTVAVNATAGVATVGVPVRVRSSVVAATGTISTSATFYSILVRTAAVSAASTVATSGQIQGAAQTHERSAAVNATAVLATAGLPFHVQERAATLTATAALEVAGESETPVPEHERAATLEAVAALTVAGIGETPLPAGYIDFPGVGIITKPISGPMVRGGQGSISKASRGALT